MYRRWGKRVFDIVVSLMALTILLPFLFLISIWIKVSSKGAIFYEQERVGESFKPFMLYKFRSMVVGADKIGPGVTSGDDPRITKIGKILRRTKIDELPQLLNVLKGEMSLVGPRPELMKFVESQKEAYKKVLSIKPGITDNASIAYRDEEKIMKQYEDKERAYIEEVLPQKIKLYNEYIDNISFISDCKLILQTLKVVPFVKQ